ncbi:MAG TPA: hypothetical protein DCL21_05185 [Alphaproteobacteria bacterium]|nr:hypothetical protein [Alphaproteobacteria bacterium]
MNKIQALLFDCDGVLLDTERQIKQEVHNWLTKKDNYNITYDEFYIKTRGQSISDTIKYLNSLNVEVSDDFFDFFDKYFIENYKNMAVKMNNVDNMLESLANYPKAVCSNGFVSLYTDTLEHHGLKKHFNEFFGIETTKHMKPKPDMFLQAAESLNVDIQNCLIIDDSCHTGVPGGKASQAGAVVGFIDEYADRQAMHDAGADYIITDLIELPEIIKNINEG